MDNSRIRKGYDVEILLGEAYFRSIFQAAYDANVRGKPDASEDNNLEALPQF